MPDFIRFDLMATAFLDLPALQSFNKSLLEVVTVFQKLINRYALFL